jgi:hypothetical protein
LLGVCGSILLIYTEGKKDSVIVKQSAEKISRSKEKVDSIAADWEEIKIQVQNKINKPSKK